MERVLMDSQHDRPASTNRWTITIVLLAMLPLIYVLSYAPLYRWMHGGDVMLVNSLRVSPPGRWETPYAPVMFLIDNTPLEAPLLWWADVWGVEISQEFDRDIRRRASRHRDPHSFSVP